jgi:nucleotide-binding universal stress UspA family protein
MKILPVKILVPVDASSAALAPIVHLANSGMKPEVLVLNVQPKFPQHVARFTSLAARDALRAERSRAAMARAIEVLSLTGMALRALSETGAPAERIAAVAEREQVDEIMMGVGRHPLWLRWLNPSIAQGVMARTDIPLTLFARGRSGPLERFAVPAGVAGLAALLLSAE